MATNIKDKIAKLLALAESPNENEAKAALLKARELMAEHKLRPEDVKKAKKEKVIRKVLDITCTAMTNPWAASLSAVIAEHYCCRAYRYRSAGSKKNKIGLVGLEEDFEIAQRIVIYAHECVMAGIKAQFVRDPKDPPGTYREKCNAYGWGFVRGVNKAFREQEEQHQEWGLVMVVPQAVDDSMADMGKKTQFGTEQTGGWRDAYRALGFQDGRRFDPASRLSDGVPGQLMIGGWCRWSARTVGGKSSASGQEGAASFATPLRSPTGASGMEPRCQRCYPC